MKEKIKKALKFTLGLPKKPILFLIKIYQKTASPDHGLLKAFFPHGFCKYYPSCSQYSYEVIKKRGLVVGLFKTGWRVLRCNPWSKGGIDKPE